VKPEKVNHFEIGLKTQFLDRRLTINAAGFWTEVNDYQATVNNNAINVIRGYLANAGKVRSRGFEWDASFRPSRRASVYFNGAYTDAKYIDFKNAPCPPELSGEAMRVAAGTTYYGDNGKARRELGYTPRDLVSGFQDTFGDQA